MNPKEAETIARRSLAESITIRHCPETPGPVYGFDPTEWHVFSYSLGGISHVGGVNCIAVRKKDGTVRYLGFLGE